MTPDSSLAEPLNRWSEQNAMLMAMAIIGSLLLHKESPPLAAALAGGSFWGLLIRFRGRWTPAGSFGPANLITLFRLLGALALLIAFEDGAVWPAGLALAILCADGLDGWTARRRGSESAFGRQFDLEVDAFFFLVLCEIVYLHGDLGAWALLPGALRYLFVLSVMAAKPPHPAVRGNRLTRAMGTIAILAFTACLLPIGPACLWLAAGATLGLCGSFLHSASQLYRPEESNG